MLIEPRSTENKVDNFYSQIPSIDFKLVPMLSGFFPFNLKKGVFLFVSVEIYLIFEVDLSVVSRKYVPFKSLIVIFLFENIDLFLLLR